MTETEADTCRRHVVPALQAAGWDTAPHSIAEQRTITDGRIVPVGRGFVRKPPCAWTSSSATGATSRSPSSRPRPATAAPRTPCSRRRNTPRCSA